MRQRILCLLAERKPDVKRVWLERLRTRPVVNAMGEPAILSYLMGGTLDQFAAQLNRRTLRKSRDAAGEFANRCRCGLNPLLAYFISGEEALVSLIEEGAALEEPGRMLLKGQWRSLAQQEIDALCGSCLRTCTSPYPHAGNLSTPMLSAGGSDRDKS